MSWDSRPRSLDVRLREKTPRYWRVQREAKAHYEAWSALPLPNEFVHPLWDDARRTFADLVVGGVPADFLRHPLVRHMFCRTGFGELQEIELDYLQTIDPGLRRLCHRYREPRVGEPMQDSRPPFSGSVETLSKLYYLARLGEMIPIESLQTIVDFGGGYGQMCHVFQQLVVPRPTVVLIDLPELLALQYFFLRIASRTPVVAHTELPIRLQAGAANLLPVQLLADSGLACDLFVSTFALSETPVSLQRLVVDHAFFGANSLYMTGQNTNEQLWRQYEFAEMSSVIRVAKELYDDIRVQPYPVVSAWELTATNAR